MIKFGTGGWRARIGEEFTSGNVRAVAAGVTRLLREDHLDDQPVDRKSTRLNSSHSV